MYFLKTTDEHSLYEVLIGAGFVEETVVSEGGDTYTIRAPANGVSLDVIGKITKATAETRIEEGKEVPVFVDLEGFHANMICTFELTEEQEAAISAISIPAPATPARTFWI